MYENHYKLKENPFAIEPDPEYLYLSPKHENALAYLRYGLIKKAPFTLLTGEIGTGKTTVGLYFLKKYCKAVKTALVSNTNVNPDQFLDLILENFNLHPPGYDKTKNLQLLHLFLIENHIKKIPSLIIIDEAQKLSEESLEEIRMLSNLHKDGKLLLQIMLIGQPELRAQLKRPSLASISQKISANYHLTALSGLETRKYINHRLEKAGGDIELFSREAKDLIYEKSAGIPRMINILCDAALVYGFAERLESVNRRAVENAVLDRDGLGTDFSSEYADSILSAPMIKDERKDEHKDERRGERREERRGERKDERKGESINDLLNRITVLEEDLRKLKKEFESSRDEIENSLNYLNNAFIKRIKKIILNERKRTGLLIKQYLRKFSKRPPSDKAFLENKNRTIVPITKKRKQDKDL